MFKFIYSIAFFCWSFVFVGTLVTGETSVFSQSLAQGVLAFLTLTKLLDKND